MTKTKSTKRALLLSALALLMCVSMLIGSTFAWFTDSVTSGNNKIVAGTLQIDLELLEKDGKWTSIKDSGKAIFDYENWEPGYTDVKILKVTNEGSLALKWIAKFVSQNDLSELADVIDVYVKPSATEFGYATDRTDLSSWTNVGTVAKFVNTISETTYGNLKAGESAYLGIALKMQESAGNKYQGMDLGGAFDIMILATQLTSETDSFNDQYDANAQYPVDIWDGKTIETPVADADGVYHISTAAELVGMMDVTGNSIYIGKTIVLENNIDLAGRTVKGIGSDGTNFAGVFDGNGYTISNFKIDATNRDYYAGLFNQVSHGGTVKNLTVKNATVVGTSMVGAVASSVDSGAVVDNCKAIDCTVSGVKKVGSVIGYSAGGTVTNNYAENCEVSYSEKEGSEILGFENTGSTVSGNTFKNVTVVKSATISAAGDLADAISGGATNVVIAEDITNTVYPAGTNAAYTITDGMTLEVDLAGNTFATTNKMFRVEAGGTLTLTSSNAGGKIVFDGAKQGGDRYGIVVEEGGVLNIEDGVVIEVVPYSAAPMACAIYNAGGTINMNGGEIIVHDTMAVFNMGNATFNMNGGKISLAPDEADPYGVGVATLIFGNDVKATVNLNGGEIAGKGIAYDPAESDESVTITVSDNFVTNVTAVEIN